MYNVHCTWYQGPASTRYSTRTRNVLSYSNSTRTKHYSDRVVSSINSRIFNNYSEVAGQKIFQQILIFKCSRPWKRWAVIWMLKRWRMFPSCTSCILKITWHTSLSPHAQCPCSSATSSLSGRWPDPPPVTIENLHCRFSIVKRSGLNEHQLWGGHFLFLLNLEKKVDLL